MLKVIENQIAFKRKLCKLIYIRTMRRWSEEDNKNEWIINKLINLMDEMMILIISFNPYLKLTTFD